MANDKLGLVTEEGGTAHETFCSPHVFQLDGLFLASDWLFYPTVEIAMIQNAVLATYLIRQSP